MAKRDIARDKEMAWHESGHVVIRILNGDILKHVTIEPVRGMAHGHIKYIEKYLSEEPFNPDRLRESARAICAGAAVDMIIIAERDCEEEVECDCDDIKMALGEMEDSTDYELMRTRINTLLELQGKGDPDRWNPDLMSPFDVLLKEIWEETIEILKDHWPTVEAIATSLLEHRTLTGKQIGVIYEAIETD